MSLAVMNFRTENALRNALLRALGDRAVEPMTEVPFLGRSLDVVYECADGSITAIEVKRLPRHVRCAIDQARTCLLAADRTYVCMPRYEVTDKIRSVFISSGIGLIFLGYRNRQPRIEYEIPAGPNSIKQAVYRERLRHAMRASGSVVA